MVQPQESRARVHVVTPWAPCACKVPLVVFLIRKQGKSFADSGLRKRSGSADHELFKIVFKVVL